MNQSVAAESTTSGTPNAAERERRYAEVRAAVGDIAAIRPGAVETARFLLDEVKASFDRSISNIANVESKATMLLGILAGTSSALGLFGTRDGKVVVLTPLVGSAMACVVFALVSLLLILRVKGVPWPDAGSYISAAMVQEDNRIGLTLVLSEAYREIRDRLSEARRREARRLFIAYAATVAAAVMLLINAATPSNESASRGTAPCPGPASASPKRPILSITPKTRERSETLN